MKQAIENTTETEPTQRRKAGHIFIKKERRSK